MRPSQSHANALTLLTYLPFLYETQNEFELEKVRNRQVNGLLLRVSAETINTSVFIVKMSC